MADRRIHEALWISFEHEAMHLETFLYMLVQSDKALPPANLKVPDFEYLAMRASQESVPNEWFVVPEQHVSFGLDNSSPNDIPSQSFGWDNEIPQRAARVHSFEAKGRPITNREYSKFLESNGLDAIPASWEISKDSSPGTNGYAKGGTSVPDTERGSATPDFLARYCVRTTFGRVPLKFVLDWPAIASFNELEAYAKWVNCRLPTFEEAKSMYDYSAVLKDRKGDDENSTNGFR